MSLAGTVKVAREGGMGKRRLHASPNSFQMDELSGFMLAALFGYTQYKTQIKILFKKSKLKSFG